MDYSTTVLPMTEARVDWISASGRRDGGGAKLAHYAAQAVEREVIAGNKRQRYSSHGYLGFKAGAWAWGWGEDGAIASVLGVGASEAAADLAQLADHWSRIDYAVTVIDASGRINPDVDYWDAWPWHDRPLRAPVTMSRIQTTSRGNTLTLGNRESASYFRVYDKHQESRGLYPRGAWRWELELKRHLSENEHARWKTLAPGPREVAGMIRQEVERAKLNVPWSEPALDWRSAEVRPRTDCDRALAWFRTQVAKSAQMVATHRGRDVVLEALGI